MLTAQLVRVRFLRNRILPSYIDPENVQLHAAADELITICRSAVGQTRSELSAQWEDTIGNGELQLVLQGFAKLLEDRCEFEVGAGRSPDEIRRTVFTRAAAARRKSEFDRPAILVAAALELEMSPAEVDSRLFADLKSEQRLAAFHDLSPERLLHRYNVALVQGVLLKAIRVVIDVHAEQPARLRPLVRKIKFHRLMCEISAPRDGVCRLTLDGPLSLFGPTQKYGVQLASFLPAVLSLRRFDLTADLLWGRDRKPKTLAVSDADRLVSDRADAGGYEIPELAMFAAQFRKKIADWRLVEESAIMPLGSTFWAPDFRLEHVATGRSVWLEVLGYWRRARAEQHYARLHEHAGRPFVLAVSEQLRIDKDDPSPPAEIVRFRQLPLPEEIAQRASAILGL